MTQSWHLTLPCCFSVLLWEKIFCLMHVGTPVNIIYFLHGNQHWLSNSIGTFGMSWNGFYKGTFLKCVEQTVLRAFGLSRSLLSLSSCLTHVTWFQTVWKVVIEYGTLLIQYDSIWNSGWFEGFTQSRVDTLLLTAQFKEHATYLPRSSQAFGGTWSASYRHQLLRQHWKHCPSWLLSPFNSRLAYVSIMEHRFLCLSPASVSHACFPECIDCAQPWLLHLIWWTNYVVSNCIFIWICIIQNFCVVKATSK